MDSNSPASQPAASPAHSNASSPSSPTETHAPAATSGFSFPLLDLGAAILECVNMAGHLDEEVKNIVHVPKGRERLTVGFEMLASMHGNLFAMLGNQHSYELDAFYDACNTYRHQQRQIAERTEMARMAGMTLEQFDAKAKEIENK